MEMKVQKLTPYQIAIDMSDNEFKKQVDRLVSPKLKDQGFKITGIGKSNGKWTIMLWNRKPPWERDAEEKDIQE